MLGDTWIIHDADGDDDDDVDGGDDDGNDDDGDDRVVSVILPSDTPLTRRRGAALVTA